MMIREYLAVHRGAWEVLKQNGFEAYFVGGCVRDALLDRAFTDIDIATDATSEQIKKIFKDTYDVGLKYGSIRVNHNGYFYDVTTYRIENGYSDSRHPDTLEHTGNLEKDLERRDFTVNAMAFAFDTGLIDLFNGTEDLANKIIRAVGKPEKRFEEDALRMMRAVRFACELGFDIEPRTKKGIMRNVESISLISKERIYSEFSRMLKGKFTEKITYLRDTNLGRSIHPDFRLLRYKNIPFQNDYILRLSYFLFKPEYAARILNLLKAENKTIKSVLHIMDKLSEGPYTTKYQVRKLISSIGIVDAKRVLLLGRSDLHVYNAILEAGDCTSLQDMQIDGDELIKAGVAQEGRQIRQILDELLEDVLNSPEHNYSNYLLGKAWEISSRNK